MNQPFRRARAGGNGQRDRHLAVAACSARITARHPECAFAACVAGPARRRLRRMARIPSRRADLRACVPGGVDRLAARKAAIGTVSAIDDVRAVPRLASPHRARRLRRCGRPAWLTSGWHGRPSGPAGATLGYRRPGAGDCLVGEPLQLHGRQRRPRGAMALIGFAAYGSRLRAVDAGIAGGRRSSRWRRRPCRSSPSTGRARRCSWATSARCRSASSRRRSASPASPGTLARVVPAAGVPPVRRRRDA